jgi:hypothetical protein
MIVLDGDDGTDNDGTGLEVGVVEALFKELGKAFRHLMFPIRTSTDHPTGGQNQSGFFQVKHNPVTKTGHPKFMRPNGRYKGVA